MSPKEIKEIKDIRDLEWHYNQKLQRYYKGCEYYKKQQLDRYLEELQTILDDMEALLREIQKWKTVRKEEILGGFKI